MAATFLLFLLHLLITTVPATQTKSSTNPFTEKAALIRYWNRKISNNLPHPFFFVSKLTPLSAVDAATFSNIASIDPSNLSTHLSSFCSSAALLCSPDLTPSLSSHPSNSDFTKYQSRIFTNYGNEAAGGLSSFKNYSDNLNVPFDSFRRYGRNSAGHDDSFSFYAPDGNVVTANFTSYGASTAGGIDNFTSYDHSSNVPDLGFINYAAEGNGRTSGFNFYSGNANSGDQSFSGYGKIGNGVIAEFASYGNNSNVIETGFANYGEDGNVNKDTFTSYGDNGNVPENNFRSYGSRANAGSDKFTGYRDQSNVGDDSFVSYEKGGNDATAEFNNYGKSFNPGSDAFKGYGEGSGNDHINFKSYFGDNTTFKSYAKTGIDFKSYHNSSSSPISTSAAMRPRINRWVEQGKFFREGSLKKGTFMQMPDIRDRMPPRSFLPRSISGKIPFSAAAVARIFKIPPGTAMANAVESTVGECERPPSRGETKRCAASAEDMIDFAVSVLGGDVAVRSTQNTKGAKERILVGEVTGVNGGMVTSSVSCHQSLYPYLVYYCHSVPRVRVYEAKILAVDSKEKINQGIAICHIDTSDWSPMHGAFVLLGHGPGKIEVCHWIFEGDMTWTIADRP
ncbi:BURP domain-containing protein 12-like [Phalaenopsis equestris]|uniref:BURP domain-containing protein 12-like n=1 Tax=Phalaenopsis equestris TaxID=78828 RepID=UPI0009E1D2A6|nr:BURP domain-containing protein 12-like [Phalaenopsis equestris]